MARLPGRQYRRQFLQGSLVLAGLGLLSGCGLAPAPTPKPPRSANIGVLAANSLDPSPEATAFRQALAQFGYVTGQNLTLQMRFGSTAEGLTHAAGELVSLGVDLIVAVEDEAIRAATNATNSIPIVMLLSPNPVGQGFVESLGRPGRNVTGLSTLSAQLNAKRLELLADTVPGLSRVALLWISVTDEPRDLQELQTAASAKGVQLDLMPRRRGGGLIDSAFQSVAVSRPDGLIVLVDAFSSGYEPNRRRLVEMALQARLPAVYESRAFVADGGLMAYGPSLPEHFRRAASYVDKILKGATPGDLPVEQPTTFDLAINLKTAQALGLSIPPSVLQQATEIIQ